MAGLAVVAAAVLVWRRWRDAVLVAVAALGAGALVVGLKALIGRVRPPQVDHLVLETNQSFPSGHALGAAAVLGVLAVVALRYLHRWVLQVAVAAAAVGATLTIGLSRLYLGVHWASDVLGGWLIGGLWLTICVTAITAWTSRPAPAAPPGAVEGDEHCGQLGQGPTGPDTDPADAPTPAHPGPERSDPTPAPRHALPTATAGPASGARSTPAAAGPHPASR